MFRTTETQVVMLKKNLIEDCLAGRMRWKQAAHFLSMHPKAISRLKRRYLEFGELALLGRKPGPKKGAAPNRTPEARECLTEELAVRYPEESPLLLTERLERDYGIRLHPVTVWRILKRRRVRRYAVRRLRWKEDPVLYCLDTPGKEIQLDAQTPWGRSLKVVLYEAVDDCTRWEFGKFYAGEECNANAVLFLTELIRRAPFRITAIRADNRMGSTLKAWLEARGIRLILNDPYHAEQNGKVERLHGTSKRECIFRMIRPDMPLDEMNYIYFLWSGHYNCLRRHGGLGMNRMTPWEKLICTTVLLPLQDNFQKVTGSLQYYIH